jgi:4-hydroxy-2-oxoheptanedioate aldolase
MDDFVEHSNAQSLVCVQLEHAAALDHVDEILAVDGVDVFFIGPSDLSQSMGYPGNPKAEPVADAIAQTLAKITAAGRIPGLPATAANVDTILGAGAKYIYTHLPKLVGAGASEFLGKGRGKSG